MLQYKTLKDAKTSWMLFVVMCISWSIVYMTKNCFGSAMAAIVSEGVMTKSQTSLISAVFWIIYAPCQVLGGRIADHHPPKVTIVIGTLGAAIANAVIYFNSHNYIVMLITWGLNAALQFGLWPSIFKIISTQLCEQIRIKCLFLVTFTAHIGLMMSYALSSVVKKWEHNFLFSSFALIIATVLFITAYHTCEAKMVCEKIEIKHHPDHIPVKHDSVGSLINRSGFGYILFASFLISAIIMGPKTLAPTMLIESYADVPVSLANGLNVAIIAVSIIGVIFVKFLYPKRIKNEVSGLACFTALSVPFLLTTIGIGKFNLLFLSVSLTAGLMFITGTNPFYASYAPSKFNRFGQGATMAGITNCMCAIGNFFASYVFAVVADNISWTASAILWSAMSVLALVCCLIALPKWKRFINED